MPSATNHIKSASKSLHATSAQIEQNSHRVQLARDLLESLGVDLNDKNYATTPERFVAFLEEFTAGLNDNVSTELDALLDVHFPKHNDLTSPYGGMVIQSPIRVYSICSHHFLPVIYDISFAYIPQNNKQLGFSKIARALQLMAQRPMNQEDYTQLVVETLKHKLQPEGLAIVVRGMHMCMSMRGAKVDTNNITSAVRGSFKDNLATREEFMQVALHYGRDRI